MKKIFFPLILIFGSLLSANAQTKTDIVLPAAGIKNITLGSNMTVVMVKAQESQKEITLSKEAREKLDISFHKGIMEVHSRTDLNQATVYLLVDDVRNLTLGENTHVTSGSILPGTEMNLYVHFGATAKLKTNGKVNAYANDDSEVFIQRITPSKTASAFN